MSLLQVAEPVQQAGHLQGHRGLPRSRVTGEAHVQVGPGSIQAELMPDPVDQQERGDLRYLLLYRQEAYQFLVQGGEHVLDARRPALVRQRDGRLGVQHLGAPPGAGLGPGFPLALWPYDGRLGWPGIVLMGLGQSVAGKADGHPEEGRARPDYYEENVR
jgi:hypothetical protein